MMKLLIDTDVIIDYLIDRAPFAAYSERIIEACIDGEAEGILTANAATDIYYIVRKIIGREKALQKLGVLLEVLDVASVGKNDLLRAMELDMTDFEDALASVCAKRINADYIVTRNIKDYSKSSVAAITPKSFLAM